MWFLAFVIFGSILLMCAMDKISEWIWPDVEPLVWEVEEEKERNERRED